MHFAAYEDLSSALQSSIVRRAF